MSSITRICLNHAKRLMFKMENTDVDYCPVCGNKLMPLDESMTNFSNYTGDLQDTIKCFTNIHPQKSAKRKKTSESIIRINQDDRFNEFTADEDFLSDLQVASDEFAYDYQDDLTEKAKAIFEDANVDIAIYDFGSDVDLDNLFDIMLSIKDDDDGYYETNTGNLPVNITEEQVKAMQDFNYSLISQIYKRYMDADNYIDDYTDDDD